MLLCRLARQITRRGKILSLHADIQIEYVRWQAALARRNAVGHRAICQDVKRNDALASRARNRVKFLRNGPVHPTAPCAGRRFEISVGCRSEAGTPHHQLARDLIKIRMIGGLGDLAIAWLARGINGQHEAGSARFMLAQCVGGIIIVARPIARVSNCPHRMDRIPARRWRSGRRGHGGLAKRIKTGQGQNHGGQSGDDMRPSAPSVDCKFDCHVRPFATQCPTIPGLEFIVKGHIASTSPAPRRKNRLPRARAIV